MRAAGPGATQPPCAFLPFQMDPVQKAVISHTFGVPTPLKKKQFISCNICHLRFNSAVSRQGAGPERGAGWASGAGASTLQRTPGPSRSEVHPMEVLLTSSSLACSLPVGACTESPGRLGRDSPASARCSATPLLPLAWGSKGKTAFALIPQPHWDAERAGGGAPCPRTPRQGHHVAQPLAAPLPRSPLALADASTGRVAEDASSLLVGLNAPRAAVPSIHHGGSSVFPLLIVLFRSVPCCLGLGGCA